MLGSVGIIFLEPRSFSLTDECEAKTKLNVREPMCAHVRSFERVDPVLGVSESNSDTETSITASDWIGVFKGPAARRT